MSKTSDLSAEAALLWLGLSSTEANPLQSAIAEAFGAALALGIQTSQVELDVASRASGSRPQSRCSSLDETAFRHVMTAAFKEVEAAGADVELPGQGFRPAGINTQGLDTGAVPAVPAAALGSAPGVVGVPAVPGVVVPPSQRR